MYVAVNVTTAPQQLLRAERKVLRLQRRLWLAQLAFWPMAATVAILAAWTFWHRARQRRTGVDSAAASSVPTAASEAPSQGSAPG